MKRACTNYTNSYEQNNTGFPLLSPSGFIRPLKIKSVWLKKMALIVTTLFALNSYLQAHPFSGGDGTLANPYKISTVVQLDSVRNYLNANFILINDLDFIGSVYDSIHNPEGWVPIGTYNGNPSTSVGLTGRFNGTGHTISNLYINRSSSAASIGLFGYTNGSRIDSLGVLNCDISGQSYVGSLVGYSYSTSISNCYATGKVRGTGEVGGLTGRNYYSLMTKCYANVQASGTQYIGGLVGFTYSSPLTNCHANGKVTGTIYIIGGLVGYHNYFSPMTDCYATGQVSGMMEVGGLVGETTSSITNCYATGQVSGSSHVGGLAGFASNSKLTNCNASGNVSGITLYAGGLVGNSSDTLINCFASGTVSGGSYVGGLLGCSSQPITNCYASGQVSGVSTYVGGLVGLSQAILTDSKATGNVTGSDYIGGLVGQATSYITNCYATGQISGNTYIGGLVGLSQSSLVYSKATGKVTGTEFVGGLVGYNAGLLMYCFASGHASGGWYVGGLVGSNFSTLANCYAAGQVYGNTSVGGLVGYNNSTLTNCYATGKVLGIGNNVGGLVGLNCSRLINCYATGKVLGTHITIGGLIGENQYTALHDKCYYNTETSGQISGIGIGIQSQFVTGLTIAEMKQQSSFTGFDFATVWSMNNGTTFPRLQATYNLPVILHTLPAFIDNNTLYTDTIRVVPMDNNNITISLEASPAGMQLNGSVITFTPDSSCVYTIAIKASDANDKFSRYIALIAAAPEGEGTKTNPYQITTIGELSTVRQKPNAYFKLMNNIDFTGSLYDSINSAEGWEPIDNFAGNFCGAGHTISNLYINRGSTDNIGLFSHITLAEIDSLGLLNCNVSGNSYVGGLAGLTDSTTITNCYASGKMSGYTMVGGLVGAGDTTILTNCYSSTNVSASSSVGGLVGMTWFSSMSNCYATGKITGTERVGGMVGSNGLSYMNNCYATGKVTGGTFATGGLLGENDFPVIHCFYNTETSGQSSGIGRGNINGVTGLTTVKMKQQSNFTGFNFSTVWAIRADSTYPALQSLNNAPFAFSDTISGVGASVSYSRFLPNDYDYETLQTALVVSIESLSSGSFRNNAVYLPDTATIGDKYIVYYRVGEVLANDTLWGNEARSVLIATTNTAPVLTAVRDTTTNEDDAITLTMRSVTATDAQGDVLSIIVHSGTNYSVSGTTVIPAAGYYGNLYVPVSVTDGRDTSNMLTMSITVIANPVYTITASAGTGGSIDPSGAVSVEEGYSQSFTITANNGYHIADVLVDGISVGAVSSYAFSNVITGHTIAANFAVTTYTITASAGNNGSINPSGAVNVVEGNSQSFTITANNNYHIEDVLVDGSSVGAVSSYTFNNVTANHAITASFDTNTVSLPEETTNCISVSPNPFINTLTISTDYWGDGYYTLVSIIGKEIKSGPLTDTITELNLSGLKSGVYLLQVKVKEKVLNMRIVKQ